MGIRHVLYKNGLFVRYKHGLTPENTPEALLWRHVIDRALVDSISVDEELAQESLEWVTVSNEGFRDVCSLSALDRSFVREKFLELFKKMKEEKQSEKPRE